MGNIFKKAEKGAELDLQAYMLKREESKTSHRLQGSSIKTDFRVNILCTGDTKTRKHNFYKIIEEKVESALNLTLCTDWIDEDEKYSCPCIIIFYLERKEQLQSILQKEYQQLKAQLNADNRKPIILIISTHAVSPETKKCFHTDTCHSVIALLIQNFQLLEDESNSESVSQLTKYILSFTESNAQDVQLPQSVVCAKKDGDVSERALNIIYSKISQRFVSLLERSINDFGYLIRLAFNETNRNMPCIAIWNREGSDRGDMDEILKHQTFEKAMMLVICDESEDSVTLQPLIDEYSLCCVAKIGLGGYYNIGNAVRQHLTDHQSKISTEPSQGDKGDSGEKDVYVCCTGGKQNAIFEYLVYLLDDSKMKIIRCSDIGNLKPGEPCVIISYEVECTMDDMSAIPVDCRAMLLKITDKDLAEEGIQSIKEKQYCCIAHINLKTYLDVLYQLDQHIKGFCEGKCQTNDQTLQTDSYKNATTRSEAEILPNKKDSTSIPIEICCFLTSLLPKKAFNSFLERHLPGCSPLWVESGRKLTGTVPCFVLCFTLSRLTDDVNGVVKELHLPPGCKAMLVVIHNCTQGMSPGPLLTYYSNDKIECFTNILYADGVCYSCDINDKAAAQVAKFIKNAKIDKFSKEPVDLKYCN